MSYKTVSVIIPTYNEEAYIKDCLSAIFAQSRLPDEVIVVDNNSTDKTIDIVSKFSQVKLLKEPQQGQVFARKQGFNAASSDLLATIDADSVVEPSWLDSMLEFSTAQEASVFSGYVYLRDISISKLVSAILNFNLFTLHKIISGKNFLFGSNLFIDQSVWREVRHDLRLDTSLWEDLELGLLAYKSGHDVKINKQKLVKVSSRAGAQIGLTDIYRRLFGGVKTYWPYQKIAAVLYFLCINFIFLVLIITRIVLSADYKPKGKYEGW